MQAGLCRTGKWWGFEHYDVVPDIVTLGKPMGNGHPLGMVITRREIAEQFAQSAIYFNTFGGNPVSAAVGLAVLDICQAGDLVTSCKTVGAYLRKQIETLAERHRLIGDVRGHGLFLGVELVHDRRSLTPASDVAKQIPDAMKEQGILMGITGRYGNVLKIRPPMTFTESHADHLVNTLDLVLTQLSSPDKD